MTDVEKALSLWYDLGDAGACVPEYIHVASINDFSRQNV